MPCWHFMPCYAIHKLSHRFPISYCALPCCDSLYAMLRHVVLYHLFLLRLNVCFVCAGLCHATLCQSISYHGFPIIGDLILCVRNSDMPCYAMDCYSSLLVSFISWVIQIFAALCYHMIPYAIYFGMPHCMSRIIFYYSFSMLNHA